MQSQHGFSLRACAMIFAMREILRHGQKAIGDALHGGDNNYDLRGLRHRPHQAGGVQHTLGAQQ